MATAKKKIRKVPEDDFGIWLEKNVPDFSKAKKEADKKKKTAPQKNNNKKEMIRKVQKMRFPFSFERMVKKCLPLKNSLQT